MNETAFIRQNLSNWNRIDILCEDVSRCEPDEVADAYQEIVTDLAYAQTHFPEARITDYLNDLALRLHVSLYRRRRGEWRRAWDFMRHDVPLAFHQCRRAMLASLLVFVVGVLIGAVSQWADPEFARVILGDYYVDMTLDNIRQGKPMDVYGSDSEGVMFCEITFHNILVSFRIFAAGILTLFGTGMTLLYNAVMIGSFQCFFMQHESLWECLLAMWLHGTLEISAIIVAGGAGLTLGTGWLFPGTFTRMEAFRRSARQSLRVIVGLIPFFVAAGFIESVCTRHTEWPDALRLTIILASLAFVVFYFVVWPRRVARTRGNASSED